VEKYHNPLVAEGGISFSYDQNIENMFKLSISVVNNCQKEIGGNSHAEIKHWRLKNITKI